MSECVRVYVLGEWNRCFTCGGGGGDDDEIYDVLCRCCRLLLVVPVMRVTIAILPPAFACHADPIFRIRCRRPNVVIVVVVVVYRNMHEKKRKKEEEGEDKRIMVEEDETAGKTPEECRDLGLWEVDLVYYSLNGNNKVKIYHVPSEREREREGENEMDNRKIDEGDSTKNKRGKAYKARSDSEYKCFEAHDGVIYRPGDHVFIEVSQCDPYYIGTISNFKMVLHSSVQILMFKSTKRDQLSVKVTRFYRPEDVPEDSYSLLLQDRQDDTSLNHAVMAAMQTRELFSSEISSVHPICHLRSVDTDGQCKQLFTF
uniref:BAH domain-containing protein n=1 Tax=Elaeophora elaphi TaxID=1147741 RepID=A0A0R3S728_9BILA